MDAALAGANFLCRHSEQISIAFPWMANRENSRQAKWQNDEAGFIACFMRIRRRLQVNISLKWGCFDFEEVELWL